MWFYHWMGLLVGLQWRVWSLTWLSVSCLCGGVASASVSPQVTQIVSLPYANALDSLRNFSRPPLRDLSELALSSSYSVAERWRALNLVATLDPVAAQSVVTKALQSKEWFMRNSALVALRQMDRRSAIQAGEKLLNDPALVVRSAAVDLLVHWRSFESVDALWEALMNPQNFRGTKSLWIRRQILEFLATSPRRGDEFRFRALLLNGTDPELHALAQRALAQAPAPVSVNE